MNTVYSRSLVPRSVVVAALFVAGSAAVLLSACGNGRTAGPGPTVISSTGIPRPLATNSPAAPATSATPVDGCPVEASTLLAALQAWPSYSSLEPTNQLTNVQCYHGYAIARTTVVHTDSAHVVFQYNASSTAWEVIAAGTAGFCTTVPADVKAHLTGC